MLARRSFLTGLVSALAAPAIVRAGSLMPVKAIVPVSARALEDIAFLEGLSQRVEQTIIYGNAFYSPTHYAGFVPFYDVPQAQERYT